MHAQREVVVWTLRAQGDHDRALEAECRLPPWVDLEQDAGTLQLLGVEPAELEPMAE